MKKKALIVLLLVCMLIVQVFSGCSFTPAAPSEDELKDALLYSSAFADYFNSAVTVNDFVVEKRQTSEESKTDIAWILVSAEDEEKSAQLSYVMTYVLYNDGWELEDLSRDMESTWEFAPLRGPSDEMIQESVPVDAISVSSEADLEENNATATYTVENNMGYCIITSARQIVFEFNRESGIWAPIDNRTLGTQNDFSPIEGTVWQYLEETDHVDTEGNTIYEGARLEIETINSETLEMTGVLKLYKSGFRLSMWDDFKQGSKEMDLSSATFRLDGSSLIMTKPRESDEAESKYKYIEFINEGDGRFSIVIRPYPGHFDDSYILEKIE